MVKKKTEAEAEQSLEGEGAIVIVGVGGCVFVVQNQAETTWRGVRGEEEKRKEERLVE